MSSYFKNFPRIKYFGVLARNVTLRVSFLDKLKQNGTIFYPYTIRDDERADTLASKYYDSPEYDWLIYLANDIVDPYTQWPKNVIEFELYIKKKYGSIQQAQSTIAYYKRIPDVAYISTDGTSFGTTPLATPYNIVVMNDDVRISVDSYSSETDPSNWVAIYAYDDEVEQNEAKRNIVLIDSDVKNLVSAEMGSLLNG
jgi:hypothetical protein